MAEERRYLKSIAEQVREIEDLVVESRQLLDQAMYALETLARRVESREPGEG